MYYGTCEPEGALVVRVGDDPGPADLRLPDGPLADLGPAAYAELRLLALPPEATFDDADLDDEPVPEPHVSPYETPAPPAPHLVHPYFQSNAFTGRAADLAELDTWLAHGQTARVISARGGVGKSALAWAWVERRLADAPPWAGCMWFSFYERGAHFEALIRRLAAYAAGVPPAEAAHGPREELERQVLAAVRARPFLIVVDGLERALVAYHRLDAMRLPDEVADEAIDLHSFTDPRDGEFLRALCQGSPSRLLATSRIFPTDLRDGEGLAPGVELRTLDGLDPAELPALLRELGLDPDGPGVGRATRAMATLDHHALLWRLLAGCMQEGPWLLAEILDREPAKLRESILEVAFDALPARAERLLARLAPLHYAAELDDVLGLFGTPLGLRRPPPPPRARLRQVEAELATETYYDTRRELLDRRDKLRALCANWDIYHALADSYARHPGTRAHFANVHADLCLLETRGFLTWDRSSNRYDLHPVVRAHALRRLDHDESTAASAAVRRHFVRAPPEGDEVACIADLRRSLEAYRAYVGLGDLDRASEFYDERLSDRLDDLSANQVTIELLTPLFPDGLCEPPALDDHTAQSWRICDLSCALAQVGREPEAAAMREVAVRLNLERRRPGNLRGSLFDRGQSLAAANRTHAAMHTLTLAHRLMLAHGHVSTGPLHARAVLATDLGRWDEAEADMAALGKAHDTFALDLCRAAIAFARGEDPAPFLEEVSAHLTSKLCVDLAADWHLLSGRIEAAHGAFAAALSHMSEAVKLARRMGSDGARAHAWRAVCLANLDRHTEARKALADARVAATRHDNRRVAGILAAAHLALGELDLAGPLALAGYREAWADGPQFSWFDDLRVCTSVLAELGLPPPELPTFDPAGSPRLPFEDEIEAFIAELAARRPAGGTPLLQMDPMLCEPAAEPGQGPPPEPGPPAFAVNGWVKVVTDAPWQADVNGLEGVVFWREPMQDHTAVAETQRWKYLVYLPAKHEYRTVIERHLTALEGSVEPSFFFGERAEISFDVVVDDDSWIVEGCLRLPGETWRTFHAEKEFYLPEACLRTFDWENGIRGLALKMPGEAPMNKAALAQAFASLLGVEQIVEAPGPDSMMMRP
ncbi:hypothetical protein OV203_05720 [Nannocystis sp. ILAH1]|uniref:hypothetical protein n=1 Tax=Nannocystis sp. ILAH1 TaxID=2996789 RepID=UPI00226F46A2|nr:hypothetical protein [Nannocystis sp. ILAH1]MCY0986607.1 hypothetical protein [Nannocystis sp. ILAH1]